MSAATTAPSGATVPAAVRDAKVGSDDPGALARAGIDGVIRAANILSQLGSENEELRALVQRQADEIAALKKHIEQMAVLA